MKNTLTCVFLFLINLLCHGQKSFEGVVKFKTEIVTNDDSKPELKEKLEKRYGDSLFLYYAKNGSFRRESLHTNETGKYQVFNSANGYLYLVKPSKTDSLNVTRNSLILVKKNKIGPEKIMGLDCDCYEYKAQTKLGDEMTITYCYSSNTPKINPKLFVRHGDFFLNEFYTMAERPFLKYTMEIKAYKIIYTATDLIEKPLSEDIFRISK